MCLSFGHFKAVGFKLIIDILTCLCIVLLVFTVSRKRVPTPFTLLDFFAHPFFGFWSNLIWNVVGSLKLALFGFKYTKTRNAHPNRVLNPLMTKVSIKLISDVPLMFYFSVNPGYRYCKIVFKTHIGGFASIRITIITITSWGSTSRCLWKTSIGPLKYIIVLQKSTSWPSNSLMVI